MIKGDLEKVRKKLYQKGIETSPMLTSVYKMKAYVDIFGRMSPCKTSEKLDKQTFTIPLHPGLKKDEIYSIIKEIKKTT